MTSSLVGSEMCIRDSNKHRASAVIKRELDNSSLVEIKTHHKEVVQAKAVSYTHLTLPTICSV
eukprot:3078040-Prorocentrum_lima.AAC.1